MEIRKCITLAAGLSVMVGAGLLVAPSASAAPAPAAVSTYVPYIVGTATPRVSGLRIRYGPGTGYTAIGLLYRGDRMTVLGEEVRPSGSWFHVRLTRKSASGLRAGDKGYVFASYLRHV